jgi:hypothetical protein
MMTYVEGRVISETVDRAAIRDLVDSWAHCADRRLPRRQAELFTTDGVVLVYAGDPASNEPVQRLQGHDELAEAFTVLNNYDVTSHVNAQSTVTLAGDRATGESYCIAHHLWVENGQRMLLTISIRYLDRFVRGVDGWRFAERRLIMDWTDKRPSQPA